MEEYSEQYKTKKSLFKHVDKILKENGSYHIDYNEDCATLYYSYTEPERLYKVLKGDISDTLKFFIPGSRSDNNPLHINAGETLIFEAEENDKVWFTYPKYLIGQETDDTEDAVGFTEHGSLSKMIDSGLIGRSLIAPCKPVIKKTIPRIRTSKQKPVPIERIYDPEEKTMARTKKLFARMKDALLDITNISRYVSNYNGKCIRTLKISELPGGGSRLKYIPSPFIRIGGRWVEKAGFLVGESVQVITIQDMILIVPVQEPPDLDSL